MNAVDDGASLALLRRRNRLRIVATLFLAVILYWLAVCAAALAVGVLLFLRVLADVGFPDDGDTWKGIALFFGATAVLSIVIGSLVAAVRLPLQRVRLERRVLAETGARVADPDTHPRVRNLLEGLAIAAGIPPPRFAVVDDPAPNSFAVGTRPNHTIVAVTSGAVDKFSRDELEAILAYEVSRIDSLDVALSSWVVALTGAAIGALDTDAKLVIGWLPYVASVRLQRWALRDTARDRDRAAVRFTRNPASLVRALEALDADRSEVRAVSRATAPLWIEVPQRVAGVDHASAPGTAGGLVLADRIVELRRLAGMPETGGREGGNAHHR